MSDAKRGHKIERYDKLLHAMQTGVRMMMEKGFFQETGPKHLRVGINSTKCDHGALVKILIEKGVITDEEYIDGIIEMMAIEVKRYEQELSQRLGGIRIRLL